MRTGRRNDCSMMSSRPRKRAPPPARINPAGIWPSRPARWRSSRMSESNSMARGSMMSVSMCGKIARGGRSPTLAISIAPLSVMKEEAAQPWRRLIRGGNEIRRRGNRGSDHVNVGDEALADHPDGVANAVLGVDNEFVRKDMQNFAVLGERNVAGGIDRAAHVFPFDVARARAKGNAAAAVCAAHVVAGHADKGFFHRHIGHAFGFFHGAADRTYRRVEIDDEAFAQTFGFGCAERQKLYELALDFGDEDGGFCAANVQPDEVFVFLRQSAAPRIKAILFLRPPCPRWSPDSRPLAAHTANRWIGHARCGPATGQNCPRASCTCRKNRRSRSER